LCTVPQFPALSPALREPLAATTGAAQSAASALFTRAEAVLEALRRRVNVLGFATRDDVEREGRLLRKRVTVLLERFADAQGTRDESLIESLKAELREAIQSLIAVLDDELYADDPVVAVGAYPSLDDIDEPDELDLRALDDEALN
jgi:hypothetical protein